MQSGREDAQRPIEYVSFGGIEDGVDSADLCEILGAGTAAVVDSKAGGAQKKALTGFSSTSVMPHAGFIFYHPIAQGVPPNLR
ncbi:unnamed protein product [Anisakis simplex]|uniref:Uncharacterized protein n=1 Tax=Anisakis simplex TaxID=6269 RepID=A0A0M3KIS7_ANISI|nr:unnamed protein product [Anisakis simplex]